MTLLNPVPTGPLTFAEWGVLANLLRRFEVNHCAPAPDMGRALVMDVQLMVKNTYCDLYVPDVTPAAMRCRCPSGQHGHS